MLQKFLLNNQLKMIKSIMSKVYPMKDQEGLFYLTFQFQILCGLEGFYRFLTLDLFGIPNGFQSLHFIQSFVLKTTRAVKKGPSMRSDGLAALAITCFYWSMIRQFSDDFGVHCPLKPI
jgi:hypothetical protein